MVRTLVQALRMPRLLPMSASANREIITEQRATLHAELELIEKGAGDALIEKIEKQVAEEEEEQRQKLEMERMEREFFKDE